MTRVLPALFSPFDDEGRELKLGALMEGGVLSGIAYDLNDESVPIVARFRLTVELMED